MSGRLNLIKTGHIATITVVAVAYVVTFAAYLADLNSEAGPPFSGAALVAATLLGIPYLFLLLADPPATRPGVESRAKTIYFLVLVGLMLTIEFLLAGSNGAWLISMPLLAVATTDLPPRPRWLVYAAIVFGLGAPFYYRYGNLESAFLATLTFSPAIVFVIVFVKLTQAAERSQAEAEHLAAQLADANRRLAEYAVQAEELAITQERNRLAREIHDNLGHYLTVAIVQIKAAQAVMDKDPQLAGAALDKAARLTQEGLAAVRQSVGTLRESPLGRQSLPEALATLAAETQAAGIVAELRIEGKPRPLDPRAELTLYRAGQEGLTNVRKHARASRVDLILDYTDPAVVALTIADNGVGRGAAGATTGFGLLGLEERARQLGGGVTAQPTPGAGFSLKVEVPSPGE